MGMIKAEVEVVPVLQDNYSFIIYHQRGCAIVDPPVVEPITERVESQQTPVTHILLTHHHADHVGAAELLSSHYDCPIVGPRDQRMPYVTNVVGDGDVISVGPGWDAEVLHVPGHTTSHIAFHFADARALFCGDLLFSGGCGRLFEGTGEQMWASLERVLSMPDNTRIFCGHEYTQSNLEFALSIDSDNPELLRYAAIVAEKRSHGQSTIPCVLGNEKAINPFLRVDQQSIQAAAGLESAANSQVFAAIRQLKDRF